MAFRQADRLSSDRRRATLRASCASNLVQRLRPNRSKSLPMFPGFGFPLSSRRLTESEWRKATLSMGVLAWRATQSTQSEWRSLQKPWNWEETMTT